MATKTTLPKLNDIRRAWYVVDAAGKPLGRMAVKVANILRGRHKVIYTPHIDTGDFVIVTNARDVKLTGSKDTKKVYQRYSGFRSGNKTATVAAVRERHPERLIEHAVKGMLPRNTMSRTIIKRLKVYSGAAHPHVAQAPKTIKID
jgi:large subunit ribosomal protein L13